VTRLVLDARTATDHFPGIGRYVVNLARVLPQAAPGLPLSLLHDPSAAATRLALPDLSRIACPVSPFSVRQQWAVPRTLKRAQATLYHSPYYLMPYRPGVPAVLTVYDLIPLLFPRHSTARARLFFRWAMTLALHAARYTIAISEATRRDFLRYFPIPPERIVAVPLAAEPVFRPQPPEVIATARAHYGLPERYALYLGSNKPHKNLVHLVGAISRTTHHASRITLVVAGDWDPRYPQARQRAEALGLGERVRFLGPVAEADLPALYSGATLFAFPSLYEGFGLPVLEALACGAPVVCSNTSSLPEVAGEAALLVDPLDENALAGAIDRLWRDDELRQELRKRGLCQPARFSWERTARETLAVYACVGGSDGN
jgi:alpha-1,3-rhamnosyl/mannosyltransferase